MIRRQFLKVVSSRTSDTNSIWAGTCKAYSFRMPYKRLVELS
jgi:hypothetical protein